MTASVQVVSKKWLLSKLMATIGYAPVRIVLWDGTEGVPPSTDPVGTVFIKDLCCLLRLAIDPELYFGE